MCCAPTPSEAAPWRLLSARELRVSFRRQVVVGGRFIADIAAPAALIGGMMVLSSIGLIGNQSVAVDSFSQAGETASLRTGVS